MPEVVFLPWLGCGQRWSAAGVQVVPQAKYLASLDREPRDWLKKYFDRYVKRDGRTPVSTICVVTGGGSTAQVFRRVRVVAASQLVYSHADALCQGSGLLGPRAERWMVLVQRFDPSREWVALLDGRTLQLWRVDQFIEVEPVSAGDVVRAVDEPVVAMAEALLQEQGDEDFLTGIDLLVEAFRTTTEHVVRLNFVLAGTALELLTGATETRRKRIRIAETLKRAIEAAADGYPGESDSVRKKVTRARRVDPALVYMWMAGCEACSKGTCARHANKFLGFYERRNKVTHEGAAGDELTRHQRPDDGQRHRWPVEEGEVENGEIGGAHAVDAALVMVGWLLLERVGSRLEREAWEMWCETLDRAAAALGMGRNS
ncbi:MAG: hypothetical protein KatS3mg081_0125 [Gemmatimonadales bacterium]|nr:MAG: hypothetical protein KatS3mg081_0125 [Gemmatimonadales bacterium]